MSSEERNKALLAAVREIFGEHAHAFILMAEVPYDDESDDTATISCWSGGANTCLGLAMRMRRRIEQAMEGADEDDDDDNEDEWKGAQA